MAVRKIAVTLPEQLDVLSDHELVECGSPIMTLPEGLTAEAVDLLLARSKDAETSAVSASSRTTWWLGRAGNAP